MVALLLLVLVVLPVVELVVLVRVVGEVGFLSTLALLVLVGAFGFWLCKQQGLGVLRRLQAAAGRGEAPDRALADGAFVALGGLLLVLPGFVSDAVAILLLLPPTRAVVRGLLWRAAARRATVVRHTSSGRAFVDVEVLDVRPAGRPGAGRGPGRGPDDPTELGPG